MFEKKLDLIKSDLSVTEIEKDLGRREIAKSFNYDIK